MFHHYYSLEPSMVRVHCEEAKTQLCFLPQIFWLQIGAQLSQDIEAHFGWAKIHLSSLRLLFSPQNIIQLWKRKQGRGMVG